MLYSQHLGLYVCIFMHTECCCRCMCCYAAVVAAAAVLLAAVRRRVPDGKICCWFIEADFSVLLFYFSSFKHDLLFIISVPLGSTLSHLRSRFAYILSNYEHARSQSECQPAAAKPPLCCQWF